MIDTRHLGAAPALTPRVFAPARVAVLKLLVSQAAIALENARLYNDLQEREARIRRLVDSNIIGIFIGDSRGQIIEANDAFLEMLGYGHDDVISGRMRWTKLTPTEWAPADEDALAQLSGTGTCRPNEKEYYRKDGSRVPVLVGGAFFERKADEGVLCHRHERPQAGGGSIAGERSEVPRLCRNRLRLVLGNRPGLQIYAIDRQCIWFRPSASNWHDVLGSRSRR